MLRYDEQVCETLPFPPRYKLPDDEAGYRLGEMLRRCASGCVELHYASGLRVPRSLFFSPLAPLLFSDEPLTRCRVTTPYLFFSGAAMSVPYDPSTDVVASVGGAETDESAFCWK